MMVKTGRTWKGIVKIIGLFLRPILSLASPMIKAELKKLLQNWYDKAKATENPIDDLLVEFIADLLGVNIS
jgi:hypothetical protein